MRPIKSKALIDQVAKETDLPKSTVEDIVNFYWKDVWEQLTKAENVKVHVTNLGDFNIKHWLLDKEIEKAKLFPSKTRLSGANRFAASVKINEKIKVLQKLKLKVAEEMQRKEFIQEHKKSIYETIQQNTHTDLEEQSPDPGRNQE